ncbi:MAG TPA: dTDP-4-dehydrorhamnose 3,5-epimerase, partial [Candidatus Saccharimonadales bacterium]|nr:dTDP-4-dehydrorhamnose 3,5-epimerase [Candidatus Saccharimonadales bacterium]
MPELIVTPADIQGLFLVDLAVHADARGSFREAFQQEKLAAAGLPPLGPVQWNISENLRRGILRGIHAEPWDKYIHVIAGEVFSAIADLRPDSATFKQVRTFTLDRTKALYVAKGLGNSYQVLSEGAIYGYLVNAHFRPGAVYLGIAWNDPELGIRWPLPAGPEDLSAKDRGLPSLR